MNIEKNLYHKLKYIIHNITNANKNLFIIYMHLKLRNKNDILRDE